MPGCIHQPSPASFGKSPKLPSSKTFSTLWKGVGCVWVQISSQGMTMGEERRIGYNDFTKNEWLSLSKRWVSYVVENLYRVFLSKWPLHTFLGNKGIYSMGEGQVSHT